jgi:hypothetical protein
VPCALEDGLFLSALLNETGLEKLEIDRETDWTIGLGYRLRKGKTLDIFKKGTGQAVGVEATGGVIINRGTVDAFGYETTAGIFINHGTVKRNTECYMGRKSRGGLYLNYGYCGVLGMQSGGGICMFNFGNADSIGVWSDGGLFVTRNRPSMDMIESRTPCWYMDPEKLENDAKLCKLVIELDKAGHLMKPDDIKNRIPKINSCAREAVRYICSHFAPLQYNRLEMID